MTNFKIGQQTCRDGSGSGGSPLEVQIKRAAQEAETRSSANSLLSILEISIDERSEALASGDFRTVSWDFARNLKMQPTLRCRSVDSVLDFIDPLLDSLFLEGRLPFSRTHQGDPWSAALLDGELWDSEPLEDFMRCWHKIAPPLFEVAFLASKSPTYQDPCVFGEELSADRRRKFRLLLAFCYELSGLQPTPGRSFPLPVVKLARLLDSDRRTTGGWLAEAVRRGFLLKTKDSTRPRGQRKGRAAEYRWALETTLDGLQPTNDST